MKKILFSMLAWLMINTLVHAKDTSYHDAIKNIKLDHSMPPHKISYYIRMKRIISKAALKDIALKIRKANSGFKNVYISYLLPRMEEGNGAWATTHFDPKLRITIYKYYANGDIIETVKRDK